MKKTSRLHILKLSIFWVALAVIPMKVLFGAWTLDKPLNASAHSKDEHLVCEGTADAASALYYLEARGVDGTGYAAYSNTSTPSSPYKWAGALLKPAPPLGEWQVSKNPHTITLSPASGASVSVSVDFVAPNP